MIELLLYVALLGTIVTIGLLVMRPAWGILAAFLAKPIVDTTWDMSGPIRLTEVISVAVPVFILLRAAFERDEYMSLRRMPLLRIWLVWTIYVTLFSTAIVYGSGLEAGAQVFFRHLNGLAGFYMIQAYFSQDTSRMRQFAWALAIAGLFPMATGFYEAVTGVHWRVTLGEDNVVRVIGFYHDAITIRVYALQTILGLLLLSVLYLRRNTIVSAAMLAYGVVAAFVIQRAYSKSGALTLASWSLLWPLLLRKYRALALVAGAAVAIGAWYATEFMDTIGFIFHKEIGALQGTVGFDRTFAGRWSTWQELMEHWNELGVMQHVFGAGQVATGAHNDYLQILFHGGFVGLAIYITLLICVLARVARNLYERMDPFSVAALLAIIMWLVDTIGLVPSAYSGYQWFVWGVIGLCFRKRQNETEAIQQPEPAVAESGGEAVGRAESSLVLARSTSPLLLNRR